LEYHREFDLTTLLNVSIDLKNHILFSIEVVGMVLEEGYGRQVVDKLVADRDFVVVEKFDCKDHFF